MAFRIPVYGVRLVREGSSASDLRTIRTPQDIYDIAAPMFEGEPRESIRVLLLDGKNNVRGVHTATSGLADASLAHAREVFQAAILANSCAVVLVHNHPSGDPTPSPADRQTTREMQKAGYLLGIPVMDHVIIGDDRFVSCAEAGIMAPERDLERATRWG